MIKLPGKLWYVGLEAYESRYTLQLTDWNTRVFDAQGIDYEVVKPALSLDTQGQIEVGQVLDGAGRPFYAMGQIQSLLSLLRDGRIRGQDTIFFEDMFHPGIESLPYLLDQMPAHQRPRIFVRCLAQTIDPDDFVHSTKMARWMKHTEQSILQFVTGVFVASHEMLSHMTIAGWKCQAVVTGLPFGRQEVRDRVGYAELPQHSVAEIDHKIWRDARAPQVVFASRTDWEKQPEFFCMLAATWRAYRRCPVKFVIASGKPLSSNNPDTKRAITQAMSWRHIEVKDNLSKNDYYKLLTESRVVFNCALQDWVSNTVSEADALGCNTLYPAYRSFPEVFSSDHTRMYTPWSLEDALQKLARMLVFKHPKIGEISKHQDGTILRTLQAIENWDTTPNKIDPTDPSYRRRLNQVTWRTGLLPLPWWSTSQPTDKEIMS